MSTSLNDKTKHTFGVFRAFSRAELVRCRVVESEPWLAAPVALTDLII